MNIPDFTLAVVGSAVYDDGSLLAARPSIMDMWREFFM